MAAQLVSRRGHQSHSQSFGGLHRRTANDDDDEDSNSVIDRGMRFGGKLEHLVIPDSSNLVDGPTIVSSAELLGRLPDPANILKQQVVGKLVSSYEWKPINIALTCSALFFSRPGEEILRDLIPLSEVVDVKRRHDIPGEDVLRATESESTVTSKSMRIKRISSLMNKERNETLHIVQIRTVENGFNSGRSYYLKAETEEACTDWILALRAQVDKAVMLKKAGPSFFRRLRYRLRRFYRNFAFQSSIALLIFFSFVVNIVQMELLAMDGSAVFTGFEYFFTAAFAVELSINIAANFLRPFFRVGGGLNLVEEGAIVLNHAMSFYIQIIINIP
jgi:hypothetical protein